MAADLNHALNNTKLNANSTKLQKYAERFHIELPDATIAPAVPNEKDFFDILNFGKNLQLDEGREHTIDVQPDLRYLTRFIIYHVHRSYPSFETKSFPYVTPYSLTAYYLALVHLQTLACDRLARRQSSPFATATVEDATFAEFFDDAMTQPVPPFLEPILKNYAPTYDPQRPNLHYCPSYAGFQFFHDFGKFIPIHLFTTAHDLVCSQRTNTDPTAVQQQFYRSTLVTFNNVNYKIGNILGTHYAEANVPQERENWFKTSVDTLFSFVTAKSQTQRPTLAPIKLQSVSHNDNHEPNPYYYALGFTEENYPQLAQFMKAMGIFVRKHYPTAKPIGHLVGQLQGCIIVNHFIEPFDLPTWTFKTVNDAGNPVPCTDANFCTHNKLLVPGKPTNAAANQNLPDPPEDFTRPDLVLLHDAPYTHDNDPLHFRTYEPRKFKSPDVVYLQPFESNPMSLEFTPILGISISNGDIDAFAVPTADPHESLHDNNSQYLQGAVRSDMLVRPTNTAAHDAVRIQPRSLKDYFNQGIAFFIGSFAKAVLPQFCTSRLPSTPFAIRNVTVETGHGYPARAFNVCATTLEGYDNIVPNYLYGWSSFRFVKRKRYPAPSDVWFYQSLRPFYGLNRVLSRTRHPSLLMPVA